MIQRIGFGEQINQKGRSMACPEFKVKIIVLLE